MIFYYCHKLENAIELKIQEEKFDKITFVKTSFIQFYKETNMLYLLQKFLV